MIADETCCPDKYSQENGSLKSCKSLMRALKILTSHDFFSGDGNSACNSCFLVSSTCSDNRKLLQGLSASIRLPCLVLLDEHLTFMNVAWKRIVSMTEYGVSPQGGRFA